MLEIIHTHIYTHICTHIHTHTHTCYVSKPVTFYNVVVPFVGNHTRTHVHTHTFTCTSIHKTLCQQTRHVLLCCSSLCWKSYTHTHIHTCYFSILAMLSCEVIPFLHTHTHSSTHTHTNTHTHKWSEYFSPLFLCCSTLNWKARARTHTHTHRHTRDPVAPKIKVMYSLYLNYISS